MLLRKLAAGSSAGFMSVSMRPPCIRATVIPRGPRSRARPLVRPVRADLAIAYKVIPGAGTRSASALPIVMIRPPSPMCRAAAWLATNTARTFDGPQPVGLVDRRFLDGATDEDPGIVDQDVEPAQLLHGLLDRGDDGAGIGAVSPD